MKDHRVEKAHSLLEKFHHVTRKVDRLVDENDYDGAIALLKERQSLLESLQELKNLDDLPSMKSSILSIIELDKKSQMLLNEKMKDTHDEITAVEKEKQSVNNLRSISRFNQKQIVDFVF